MGGWGWGWDDCTEVIHRYTDALDLVECNSGDLEVTGCTRLGIFQGLRILGFCCWEHIATRDLLRIYTRLHLRDQYQVFQIINWSVGT